MSHESVLPPAFVRAIRQVVAEDAVLEQKADRWSYGYDNSRKHALPGLVVMPGSNDEVAQVVALCYEHGIAVVGRGSGTGTAGGSVPLNGAIVISTERLNRILDFDPDNRLMVVQSGVTNKQVQERAAEAGFFWPPDPTSSAVCTVGGNLACNAAGPRAVKYGTPRENTLGLTAVSGTGELYRTGVHTTKGVVGYDLTRLLIGSEGTLGIITEAILKLTPLPETRRTLRVLYQDIHAAAKAVARIMAQPVTPCTLEFMDAGAINMIRTYSEVTFPDDAGALLMIEVDGSHRSIEEAAEAVSNAASGEGCVELFEAKTDEEVQQLWRTRKALSPALRNVAPKKINEDVVVPVSRMPELIDGLTQLSQRHGITIVNFGHAGNGNIHVNLLANPDDPAEMARAEECLSNVFDLVLELDGTLSGEHGVGTEKRPYIARELDPVALSLMHAVKQQFDPKGILNPGKTLPDPRAN